MNGLKSGSGAHPPVFSGRVWRGGRFESARFSVCKGKIGPASGGPLFESAYIIPPFADPHIHGGWGADFSDGEFARMEDRLLSAGIAFAVPTLVNSSPADLRRAAAAFRAFRERRPDTIFPFLRVEGPFINPDKKGFQKEDHIRGITEARIREFLSIPEIGMFTFAPEIPGTEDLVVRALESGRLPSVGHSQASFRDLVRVYDRGVRHFTHYPNAMSACHHRDIGLTGAGLLLDDLQLEIIADGIHTSDDFLDLVLKARGPDFALTSDLIPPALSPRSNFDDRSLVRKGRRLSLPDGTLAGGGTPVPDQFRRLFLRGIPIDRLVPMACLHTRSWFDRPAGELTEGGDADFCCLDADLRVTAVFRHGVSVSGGRNE